MRGSCSPESLLEEKSLARSRLRPPGSGRHLRVDLTGLTTAPPGFVALRPRCAQSVSARPEPRVRFSRDRWPGAARRPQWLFSGNRSGFGSRSQNMTELLKSAPASIPLVETPDSLHKHADHIRLARFGQRVRSETTSTSKRRAALLMSETMDALQSSISSITLRYDVKLGTPSSSTATMICATPAD